MLATIYNRMIPGFCILMFAAACMVSKKNIRHQELLVYRGTPITTVDQWNKKRKAVLAHMQEAMGPLPRLKNHPPFNTLVLDSVMESTYTRYTIKFTVEKGEALPALLYVPAGYTTGGRAPAVIALHGTDRLGKLSVAGQSALANRDYAKKLAERGYVVLAPDYPSFGDLVNYDFDRDRYQSGTMKGIFNHIRCVDYLQSLSFVNPDKIAVIGHSLGGHNAIFLGAFDQRVKVVIASCGWTLFPYYDLGPAMEKQYGGKLGPWSQKRYMPLLKEKYHLNAEKIPFDFDEVIAAIAPRIFLTNSPLRDANFSIEGVRAGLKNIRKVYELYHAPGALYAFFPEAGHDFPPDVTKAAFQVLDSAFKK
ncbi:alpha/beta fold hydrolase [Niabella sp. CC-SYL272]|uniref:alpha/beta hydrolase n=1 Tax=Niabella agricola TaxID=2891571 RepID=UPI001F48BB8D|nr:alpha/beta fold hydrolase [Niabella agricola]MCF3108737.1 alpha/beta fold hydrolase [Niabella agricola]